MTLLAFPDRVKITTATTGTGTLTLGSPPTGFQGTPALVNATPYRYTLLDVNGVDWETGVGVYTASGTTFTRVPLTSSNSNAAISLSAGGSTLMIGPVGIMAESDSRARRGFIAGLGPKWTSTTVLGVQSAGSVHIESSDSVIYGSPADITPSSPSASTWYHVYVYSNAGVLTLESSTTAPVAYADASGTTRSKTGDPSRRYLYSAKTNASSVFYEWRYDAATNMVFYQENNEAAPFRLIGATAAGTVLTVDASPVVPVTCRSFFGRFQLTTASMTTYCTPADVTPSSTKKVFAYTSVSPHVGLALCDSTQQIKIISSTGTAANYVDVTGYPLTR